SDPAQALISQPSATNTPPAATINLGPFWPRESTIHPSSGVSQVSSATKVLNATWMLATSQECALAIGLTKKVQPYCRLAIIAMQMTPMISCIHRKPLEIPWPGAFAAVTVIMSLPMRASFESLLGRAQRCRSGNSGIIYSTAQGRFCLAATNGGGVGLENANGLEIEAIGIGLWTNRVGSTQTPQRGISPLRMVISA